MNTIFLRRDKRTGRKKRLAVLFSVLLGLISFNAHSQGSQITGRVTNTDGSPIPGVNIMIKGTTTGTISDADGAYTLSTDQTDNTIVFSAIGYTAQEYNVSGEQILDVSLAEDLTELEEIVVIGYGTQRTSLVTGSISSINAEQIERTSSQRVEDALQGKTPGVFILPESGSPGAGMKVRIRGTGTNGDANPLYIVDGIRMSDVNDIAPSDIESVEILKDAASAAIYGAEGGNGVVIMTTKSGKSGEGRVSYNFSYGIQSAGKLPDLLNAEQYNQFQTERGFTPTTSSYDTDWLNEVFNDAPVSTHNLSFSGGNENSSYYSSFNYYDQDGIIGGEKANYKRLTTRLNVNHQIKTWLKVGMNINYAHSTRRKLNEDDEFGGIISSTLLIDPYTPTHYAPEDITANMQELIDEGEPVRMDSDGRYFAISDNVQGEMVNPLLQIDLAQGKSITDRLIGSFRIDITPFKGLTLTSRPGVDFSKTNFHEWTPLYYYSAERSNSSLSVVDNFDTYYQWQWENFASYQKQLGLHNISAVIGMSAQESKDKYLNTNTGDMVSEGDEYAEHDYTSSTEGTVSGNEYPNRLISYFGRVSYDYKGRYLIQATLRNDKTSTTNVPLENNGGIFPSVSAGWTISEEDFFPNDFVNKLKIRGSWGQNGSIKSIISKAREDGQFLYTSTITSEDLRYPVDNDGNYVIPAEPRVLANPDLTWETSEQTNIGMEIGFWQNRISVTADYFIKNTKDLLMRAQYPATAGTGMPYINAGDVKNSGFEFSFGIRNNDKEFKYGMNFNFATLKNEVTKLNLPSARLDGTEIGTGSWEGATAFEVGEPIWYFRGYETNGIDETTGDPVYVDHDGVDGITDDDRVNLGDPLPDFMYGANLFLEYKGFDFNVFVQGQYGNQAVYGWIRTDRLTSNMPLEFYEDRWTTSNTNASMPAADADSKMYASDIMVKDAGYTRIKQIQLGYTLPSSLLETIKLYNLHIFISLDDFFTFTGYNGMDPEAGSEYDDSQGIDRGVYPTPRKTMFGLAVSF